MNAAMGHLVATLDMDNGPFMASSSASIAELTRLERQSFAMGAAVEKTSTSVSGLYRSEKFLAHGLEQAGAAVMSQNAALGGMLMASGEAMTVIAMTHKGYSALSKEIAACTLARLADTAATIAGTAALAAFWLVSNPVGWAIMAGGALAAAVAWESWGRTVDEATSKLEENNKERAKQFYAGTIPDVKADYSEQSASTLNSEIRQTQRNLEAAKTEATALGYAYLDAQDKYRRGEYSNLQDPGAPVAAAATAAANASSRVGQLNSQLDVLRNALPAAEARERMQHVNDGLNQMADAVARATMSAEEYARSKFMETGPSQAAIKAYDDMAASIKKADDAEAAAKEHDALVNRGVDLAKTPQDEYASKVTALDAAKEAGKITESQYANAKKSLLDGMTGDALVNRGVDLTKTPQDEYASKVTALDAAKEAGKITESQYANAKKSLLDGMTGVDKMVQAGKRMAEHLMTPAEKYERAIMDARNLLNAGAIDKTTYGRAVAAAQAEAKGTQQDKELPRAIEMGSDEAWKSIVSSMYGKTDNKPAEQTADNTLRMANAMDTLNDFLTANGAETIGIP